MKKICTRLLRLIFRFLLLVTPASYHLPLRYKLQEIEGSNGDELTYLDHFLPRSGTAIDIGANIGMFSYRLALLSPKVISFEINTDIVAELAAWNPGQVEIISKGLSSAPGQASLFIPVLRGQRLIGWSSLNRDNCPDTNEYVERTVELVTLDSSHFSDVSFIKIDVEGHELEVLRGARETLLANRPTVLVEIRKEYLDDIREFFLELGYQEKTVLQMTGHQGSGCDYVFVPA